MSTSTSTKPFKAQHSFEKRKSEADRIREKYPDRIPVIAEKFAKSTLPDIDKKKYLVPADLTMGQFLYVIRKRIKLSQDQTILIYVNNKLAAATSQMSHIYKENVDEDGFLYVTYAEESTFGN